MKKRIALSLTLIGLTSGISTTSKKHDPVDYEKGTHIKLIK